MSNGKWYSTGWDTSREINEQRGQATDFGNNDRSRLWMRPGESRTIIFLDDLEWKRDIDGDVIPVVPFCRYEHKVLFNDDWKNPVYVTCTKGISPCKFCDMNFRRQHVGALTVLDVTPFVDKTTGETKVRPFKKLLVAPPSTMVVIEAKKQKKGGNLKGLKYSVARHDRKQARSGQDFEFEAVAEMAAYNKEGLDIAPYGFTADQAFQFYLDLFKPIPYEKQEQMCSGRNVTDGSVFRGDRRGGGPSQPANTAEEVIQY